MDEGLCLRCFSTALTVIYFVDSPGSTVHEAGSTTTDIGYSDSRHPIFFSCCDGEDRIYVRERRYSLTCLHVISHGLPLHLRYRHNIGCDTNACALSLVPYSPNTAKQDESIASAKHGYFYEEVLSITHGYRSDVAAHATPG